VHSPRELISAYEEIFPSGIEVIVQSIISTQTGDHFNLRAYLGENGERLGLFTSRKIRQYPVQFGVGTMIESVEEPEVVELGLRFADGVGYRGFASIEFMRDDHDGQFKLIELNPRYASQIIHATDCGVNFPLIQYLDLAGMAVTPQTTYKTGVTWLSTVGDLRSGWAHMRAGRLSPWAWIRSWAGSRSFAVFAPDDIKPFLKYLATLPSKDHRRAMATDEAPASSPISATVPVPPAH
jgi:predicted ATP-grasp superfamily ATP-dependent carboligase